MEASYSQQRHAHLKRKRSTLQHEDIPWTTARCNRLLRTITSRVHILRKLSRSSDVSSLRDDYQALVEARSEPYSGLHGLSSLGTPEGKDPEWLPQAKANHNGTRTYTGRAKICTSDPKATNAAGSGFRTPFIKRILRPQSQGSPLDGDLSMSTSKSHVLRCAQRKTRKLPVLPTTSKDKAQKALLSAFDTLLYSTRPPARSGRIGAGSLRDMCLRKVPDYIGDEQEVSDADEDQDGCAVAAEVYGYLESFGVGSDKGWPGLRLVVRAHGVKLIADAIHNRLIHDSLVDEVISICKKNHAVVEAQAVLEAWIMRLDASVLVTKLVEYCRTLGTAAFLFRNLQEMLDRRSVVDLSQHPDIWRELLKAFARLSDRARAVAFLESYALSTVRTTEHNNFLRRVLVPITALAWTQHHRDERAQRNGSHDTIQHMYQLAVTTRLEPFITSTVTLSVACVKTEAALPSLNMLTEMLDHAPHHLGHDDDRAGFVTDIAKCLARADGAGSDDFVKATADGLLRAAENTTASTRNLLRRLAVDSTMAWAEYKDDTAAHTLAEEVADAASHGSLHASQTDRYRWEAGLREWIAATPLATKECDTGARRSIAAEDSGICMETEEEDLDELAPTPIRPRKARKGKNVSHYPSSSSLHARISSATCESDDELGL